MTKLDGTDHALTCPECGAQDPNMKPRGGWLICNARKPGGAPFYRCGQLLLPLPPFGLADQAEAMARHIFGQCGLKECPCGSETCPVVTYRRLTSKPCGEKA
jgi:hypothetical protein